ncbi:hypothetical protein PpBr36_04104 [Pyricularia pennisetigena]|uniref:hypothetical protein n=1 Tax=Pyricularia pennisetigena TaxID=1578925 RepID=UPI0011505D66|nr:hypothetical protein PpBr36_04104 [Pyricularia pennisetigena]TLS27444.1 hypothetical protein PpBr36_04104 [Pyricularia pennisetigena]
MSPFDQTHAALVTVAPRAPLQIQQRLTRPPRGNEILIRSSFTASTPLDLHRADGGLLVHGDECMGATTVGIVSEVGPDVTRFKPGDRVFGWAFESQEQRAHQEYVTAPDWLFAHIPEGFSMEQVATVPENLITAFNTIGFDLGLPTPWPKPEGYVPPRAAEPILVWGAASSVGQFTVELLKFYGYRHVLATASPVHHEYLRELGATECFDYRDPEITKLLMEAGRRIRGDAKPTIPMIVDCIGSVSGTLEHISKVAEKGSTVAVMIPVILKMPTQTQAPEYSMEVHGHNKWNDGVSLRGVRTFFVYKNSEFFREKLASQIVPEALVQGIVRPQRYRVIEGKTMLERGEKALDALRDGVSGEKLVWRTNNE